MRKITRQQLQTDVGHPARVSASDFATPYDIATFTQTKPTASEVVCYLKAVRAFKVPANFSGSVAGASVAATSSTTFQVQRNGSSIGSFAFSASATTATFSSSAETTFNAGDVLTIVAPATPDATLSNLYLTLSATLVGG